MRRFRGGESITNMDQRPAHVDSILQYGYAGHPDFFLLACAVASAEGGGASYLVDLERCLAEMEPWAAAGLQDLEVVQQIKLPPDYGSYARDNRDDPLDFEEGAAEAELASPPSGDRVEKLSLRTRAGCGAGGRWQ